MKTSCRLSLGRLKLGNVVWYPTLGFAINPREDTPSLPSIPFPAVKCSRVAGTAHGELPIASWDESMCVCFPSSHEIWVPPWDGWHCLWGLLAHIWCHEHRDTVGRCHHLPNERWSRGRPREPAAGWVLIAAVLSRCD